jgi:effector-binding domain-containing protein
MSYQCTILEHPEQATLAIRTRTAAQDLPQAIGEAYGRICAYLQAAGVQSAGAPYVGYFNCDMQDLDVEMGIPVAESLPGQGEIISSSLPAGAYASCVHTGAYQAIEPAYAILMQWMQEQGLEGTGIAYEIYWDDPAETPEAELRTLVLLQLR